jgi:hypothetical protein
MANTSPSRNPFADPTLPTLADLLARIQAEEALPLRTRQNWCWALRAVSRAVGRDPTAVPGHPKFLRKLLDRAAPASLGMSRAGWNNARSLMGKALKWAASIPGHYSGAVLAGLGRTLEEAVALNRPQPSTGPVDALQLCPGHRPERD